jgi:3-deoxy-D-manno-octulosonic-acid transferase
MVRLVYSILVAICIPFVLAKLLWRGLKAPEYRQRRLERLGFFAAPQQAQNIWVHAVSVGEVLAAEPIIRELLKRYPKQTITVTCMTPTSSALLSKLFPNNEVFHVYAPYDFPLFVKAFLRRIRPRLVIIMETELWPNMIHYSRLQGCPVILANARLSERSANGYRKLLPAVGWLLQELTLVLCQFQNDADRFRSLGIADQKIKVTGSLKYDIVLAADLAEQSSFIRSELMENQLVWVAASTHEGEDEIVLAVHQRLKKIIPSLVLVLVPRHPERFQSAFVQSKALGFNTYRYSKCEHIKPDADVYVLDTMGKLMAFYTASDLVFIGGSFVEVGGHNPIEPGALGKPMFIGPHYFNFEVICKQFEQAGALEIVADQGALVESMSNMLLGKVDAAEVGNKALDVVTQGRGAVARVVDEVALYLKE